MTVTTPEPISTGASPDLPVRRARRRKATTPNDANGGSTATTAKGVALHVTGRRPEMVAMIACGPTQAAWHAANVGYGWAFGKPPDEIWTLNKALRTVRADVGFVMDDLVGEGRKAEAYRQDLNAVRIPIITSIVDEQTRAMYPDAILHEYPLAHVWWYLGYRICRARGDAPDMITCEDVQRVGMNTGNYCHNSLPYMLAYALFIGVKHLLLFGADYTHPTNPADVREDDRSNCEYWVGLCRGLGMRIDVPSTTTLLNTMYRKPLYGYGARAPLLDKPTPADLQRYRDMSDGSRSV